MAVFTLVDGKKSPLDTIVLLTCYQDALTLAELLYLNKCVMDSDHVNYRIEEGKLGKAMFLSAVCELALGIPFQRILERYDLTKKAKLNIIDKRSSAHVQGARLEKELVE